MRTVTGLFDTYDDAQRAAKGLEAAGVRSHDISILSHDENVKSGDTLALEGAETGAGIGALAGGAGGLLTSLGVLAIPGVGPIVAAGWLVATLTGAVAGALAGGATGGLIGTLIDSGIPEDDAHVYAEGMRRGGTIMVARVDEAQVDAAAAILRQSNAVEPTVRRRDFENDGWAGFDEKAPPYLPDQLRLLRTKTYENS